MKEHAKWNQWVQVKVQHCGKVLNYPYFLSILSETFLYVFFTWSFSEKSISLFAKLLMNQL